MKKILITLTMVFLGSAAGLFGQTGGGSGMTLNGSSGLIVVPDGRLSGENAEFGLNFGYGIVYTGGKTVQHLPRYSLSFLKKFEISGLLQAEGELKNLVTTLKFQLIRDGGAALSLGGDFEWAFGNSKNSSKFYVSATYGGEFFGLPASTSAMVGWQILQEGKISSQLLYGMGFSVNLFSKNLGDRIYWVTDFGNFSYTVVGAKVNANSRGSFNTGIRIYPVKLENFSLMFDVFGTDLLDNGERGISASLSGGITF